MMEQVEQPSIAFQYIRLTALRAINVMVPARFRFRSAMNPLFQFFSGRADAFVATVVMCQPCMD